MFLTDSHCHIDRLNYNLLHKSLEDVLNKSYKNHVKNLLAVSTSINNFHKIQKISQKNKNIYYSCGIHPLNCKKELKNFHTLEIISKKIEEQSYLKNVVALGESGLDYHHSIENKNIQKDFFREHIRIAIKVKKPIIVHSRNAINDTIKILKEENAQDCKGVLHSFTENYDSAYKLLDIGFYISISGIITFKNAIQLKNTIKKIPLERLLIETDSPYLSPEPHRGLENQPAYLFNTAQCISSLMKTDIKILANITTKNFRRLFNIKNINI